MNNRREKTGRSEGKLREYIYIRKYNIRDQEIDRQNFDLPNKTPLIYTAVMLAMKGGLMVAGSVREKLKPCTTPRQGHTASAVQL